MMYFVDDPAIPEEPEHDFSNLPPEEAEKLALELARQFGG